MNDVSYIRSLSDPAILKEIGAFIKMHRVEQNRSQEEVAERAAISRSTLSLTERGENISLSNLIKILRVLDVLYVFEKFRVTKQISPLQLAKEDEKKRRRSYKRNSKQNKNSEEW